MREDTLQKHHKRIHTYTPLARSIIIVFIKGVGKTRVHGKTTGVFFVALQLFLPAKSNFNNFNFNDVFLDEEE